MPNRLTCLVTGCAGFVGSHLAERLLVLGHTVVGVDNFFSGHRRNMATFATNPNFHFYERSITDPDIITELREAHPGLDRVMHLAAIVSVPYSIDHEEETMRVNWEATRAMHEEATTLGFHSFVYAGSAAEYGDTKTLPTPETDADDSTVHLSPYGRAKYLSSILMKSGAMGCSLRFFNIYGSRQDPSSPYSGVISIFIDRFLARKGVTIFGDGENTRDFIHVSDVVDAYMLAAGIDAPPLRGIYNVATGKGTTIRTLAETVAEVAGAEPVIEFAPPRQGDIIHSIADPSKIFAKGFTPKVNLRQGLESTVDSVRNDAG